MDNEDRDALFKKLVEEKATCLEFAWNGFVRMYEEGEKKCECSSCKAIDKLKDDIDAIYTRVPIDMPFDIPKTTSYARLQHNAKYLENQQRLKNLEDMDNARKCPKCGYFLIEIISWDIPLEVCQRCQYENQIQKKLYEESVTPPSSTVTTLKE